MPQGSLQWHSNRESGDVIDKINNATEGLYSFSGSSYNIISNIIKVFGTTFVIIFFNVWVGIFAFTLLSIAFYVLIKFDKKLIPQYKELNRFRNKFSGKTFDILSNITSIKILNIEKTSLKSLEKPMWASFSLFRKNKRTVEMKWFAGSVVFQMVIVLPLIMYILFIYSDTELIKIGTISMMYIYLNDLYDVYFSFASIYEDFMIYKTKIQNVEKIEKYFYKNTNIKKISVNPWDKLSIKNLNFKYSESRGDKKHLDEINLKIKKGEKIAFIGKTGSGKTTFLKVIHGLYDEAKACVVFDSGKVKKTNFRNINLKTMLVPQELELFPSSIRENVTFGLEYSDEEVLRILELVNFSEVLKSLPKELDSVVNEKGVNLSGGQKQILALARALLFSDGKEMILLDESTSSVDPKSEVKIYQNIFKEFEGKTFLASIHKMNLLKYFDRIVIFKDGKIVDEGDFKYLYEKNSDFKKQWDEYVEEK